MSTAEKQLAPAYKNKEREFRALTSKIATSLLTEWVGEDRSGEAIGRISAALSASASAARNPADFYQCTPQSIGGCIAIAALTEIMPGNGATALAYVIPRRPRKGEAPQLQFQFSHRGLNALARRTGQTMIAVPISTRDEVDVNVYGEVRVPSRDIDNPPTSEEDFRGCVLLVRELRGGTTTYCGWVPKCLINQRRDGSDAYQYAKRNDWAQKSDPWHQWYIEMAMKTAMHYAISRGWCTIDDAAATRALSHEQQQALPAADTQPRLAAPSSMDELTERLTKQHGDGESTSEPEPDEPPPEEAKPLERPQDAIAEALDREAIYGRISRCGTKDDVLAVLHDWSGKASDDDQLWLESEIESRLQTLKEKPAKGKQKQAFEKGETYA